MGLYHDNSERILVHYLWTHKKGNYLQISRGIGMDIDTAYLHYITDWSIQPENSDRYWYRDEEVMYVDFLPILERLKDKEYITMELLDVQTYAIRLRPKFETLPFIEELLEPPTSMTTKVEENALGSFSSYCKLDEKTHAIIIYGRNYYGFGDLFEKHKRAINQIKKADKNNPKKIQKEIESRKSKRKGGIRLIFAIIKCREKRPSSNTFSLDEVYKKYKLMAKDGREKNREMKNTGKSSDKFGIKETDCQSAGTVFKISGLQVSVVSNPEEGTLEIVKGGKRSQKKKTKKPLSS